MTDGNIKGLKSNDQLIRKMFIGIMITNLISIVSNIGCTMIDSIVTGQFLGTDAVTASGLLQPVILVINLSGGLIEGGLGVVCARHMGKAETQRANQTYSIITITTLIFCICVMGAVFLLAPGLGQALSKGITSQVIPGMISDYLRGFILGMIPMRLTIMFTSIMMLDNDKNRGVMAMITTLVTDLIFDLANVLIFHGGMFGMAIATSLSNTAGFMVILTHFLRKNRILRFTFKGLNFGDLKDVVMCGIPHGINMGSMALRGFIFNKFLLVISGQVAVAGLAVCNGAFSVVNALCLGMFFSAATISSMFYGEEDRKSLEKGVSLSFFFTVLIVGTCCLLIIIFPTPVARLFIEGSATGVLEQGSRFIRFMGIQYLLVSIGFTISGIYQATKRFKLNYLIDFMREGVTPIVCVVAGGLLFGIHGTEWGFAFAGVPLIVLCFMIPTLINKKIPKRPEDVLILPDDFGAGPEELFAASMSSIDDVIAVSEGVMDFAKERGGDRRTCMMLSLFIEEMARNTIEHGFEGRPAGSIDIRLIYKDDSKTIRMRDDGKPFDPVEWIKRNEETDPSSGFGIRMVTKLAKSVNYLATMEINNLIIQL